MLFTPKDQRHDGAEAGAAVGLALHLPEQQAHIGLRVMVGAPLLSGIAGRTHSRSAIEGVHLQAGVVGEAIVAVALFHPAGFEQGIALDGVGGLGDIVVTSYLGQRQHTAIAPHYLPHFLQFMGIVGGKHYLFGQLHHFFPYRLLYIVQKQEAL